MPAYAADRLTLQLRHPAARIAYRARSAVAAIGVPALDRALRSLGARIEPEFRGESPPPPGSNAPDFTSFYVVHLPPGVALASALQRFAALDEVAAASPIGIAAVAAVPNDSLWSTSWWLYQTSRHDVRAPEAWDLTRGDTSSVVALIDTGLIPDHPDIGGTTAGSRGQIWTNRGESGGAPGVDDDQNGFVDDVAGWDFVALASEAGVTPGEDWRDEDPDPTDYVGHGTLVAGVLGAMNDNHAGVSGMAWNLRIMPLRVGWSLIERQTGIVDMVYLARAIRYATRMGATVINISLGTSALLELDYAVDAAIAAGIPVVIAAGNNGSPNGLIDRPGLIHVAATDRNDVVPVWSNLGVHVDLSAPGADLISTVLLRTGPDSLALRRPGYATGVNGTSFSAPLVSGAVALIQAYRRQLGARPLDAEETRIALMGGCDDISAANPNLLPVYYGSGRLNVERSLRLVREGGLSTGLGAALAGPMVEFRGGAGERRLACATVAGSLILMDALTLQRRATQPLGAVPQSGIAAADLGMGRGVGFFVSLSGGRMGGFGGAGLPLPGWPVSGAQTTLAEPALGDLDADAIPEVVTVAPHPTDQTRSQIWVWDSVGRPRAGFPLTVGRHAPGSACALGDLDGVPGAEIVVAEETGWVHAIGANGAELAGWPARGDDGIPATPVIASVEGAPAALVVHPSAVIMIRANGTVTPRATFTGSLPAFAPALGDVDGDGSDDLVMTTPRSARVLFPSRQPPNLVEWLDDWGLYPINASPLLGHWNAGATPELIVGTTDGVRTFRADQDAGPLWGAPSVAFPNLVPWLNGERARLLTGSARSEALYAHDAPEDPGSSLFPPWPTARGNYARTGSRHDVPPMAPAEERAPVPVDDLQGAPLRANQVRLTWTSRPDDPATGRTADYDLRWGLMPISPTLFSVSPRIDGLPAPSAPGTRETLVVAAPIASLRYYCLRARDGAGNWSEISNSVGVRTPSISPLGVTDLTAESATESTLALRWTATGDDGDLGRPGRYDVRGSLTSLNASNFGTAPFRMIHLATVDAGGTERAILGGFPRGARVFVAVRAVDTAGNASGISNVVEATLFVSAAPARVTDLEVTAASESTLAMRWTATGADGSVGRPHHYQLRASLLPISDANFATAASHADPPATGDAGAVEVATIATPVRNASWWVALRAVDEFGVVSPTSNLVQGRTLPSRFPATVIDLRVMAATESSVTLQWTATGADEWIGRPDHYDLRAAPRRFGALDFESATLRRPHPATVDAGGVESATFDGLPTSASLWIGLRALDAAGYASQVSNVVEARTTDGRLKVTPTRFELSLSRNPASPPIAFVWAAPEARGEWASIAIHDLSGRLRRRIGLPRDVTGRVEWDGTDEHGHRLGAGIYFVSLTRGDAGVRRRMVLLPR